MKHMIGRKCQDMSKISAEHLNIPDAASLPEESTVPFAALKEAYY